jgi:ABC-type uncharacterized transport system involved in gliding motility auxiliary subunit
MIEEADDVSEIEDDGLHPVLSSFSVRVKQSSILNQSATAGQLQVRKQGKPGKLAAFRR